MTQHPIDPRASDARVFDVAGALRRALVDCVRRLPDVTEEELLAALLDVATRKVERLRNGQGTDIVGDVGVVPAAWVSAFDQAVAAVGCGSCGKTKPCRCYVPPDQRPNKTAAGLAAVVPLITAVLGGRPDANRC